VTGVQTCALPIWSCVNALAGQPAAITSIPVGLCN
jgi:hypothetical protein